MRDPSTEFLPGKRQIRKRILIFLSVRIVPMNTRAFIKLGCALAVLFVFSHEAAWTQVLDRIAAFREQERRAVAEPFKGVTTDGNILFWAIKS